MDLLSERARRNLENVGFGDWLMTVPETVELACARWQITQLERLEGGLGSVTLLGMRQGQPVVLKLCHPLETLAQPLGMARIAGLGGPPLLESDPEQGLLVMPFLPGSRPQQLPRLEWILEMLASWRALEVQGLPPLSHLAYPRLELVQDLDLPPSLSLMVEQAIYVTRQLLDSMPPQALQLIHTDLGPHNLWLSAEGEMLVLDCSACVGEAAYDLGHWIALASASPSVTLREVRRASQLSGIPSERIAGWAFQRAASSGAAGWARGDREFGVACMSKARALRTLL